MLRIRWYIIITLKWKVEFFINIEIAGMRIYLHIIPRIYVDLLGLAAQTLHAAQCSPRLLEQN